MMAQDTRPQLARKARVRIDPVRRETLLLSPEHGLVLSTSAAAILGLCDGERTLDDIVNVLASRHPETARAEIERDVHELIGALSARGLLEARS